MLEIASVFLGLLGGAVTSYFKRKMTQDKYKHDIDMAEQDRLLIQAEADKAVKITEAQTEATIEIAEGQAYTVSQTVGNKDAFGNRYMTLLMEEDSWIKYVSKPIGVLLCLLFGLVDFAHKSTRMALTVYYAGASAWITWEIYHLTTLYQGRLADEYIAAMLQRGVDGIFCLAITCVTWWFADKKMEKFLMDRYDAK